MLNRVVPATLIALAVSSAAFAEKKVEGMSEETSLSRYQIVEEGQEFLTLQDLEPLEDQAKALFAQGKCEKGLELDFAGAANRSANVLRQTLEPFYNAERDDRDWLGRRSYFGQLVETENASNELLNRRNEVWVLEAKCFLERGDKEKALVRLYRALDFIDGMDQGGLWEEARTMIWEIVGFEPSAS
jgi:tetratricopeptide (TPR) repeat protein